MDSHRGPARAAAASKLKSFRCASARHLSACTGPWPADALGVGMSADSDARLTAQGLVVAWRFQAGILPSSESS